MTKVMHEDCCISKKGILFTAQIGNNESGLVEYNKEWFYKTIPSFI